MYAIGMSQPCRNRRSTADYRWTRDKMIGFLKALSLGASVAAAAREVGMGRQSAYRLRARLGPDFARLWGQATDMAYAGGRGPVSRGVQGDRLSDKATPSAQNDPLDSVNRVNPTVALRMAEAAGIAAQAPLAFAAVSSKRRAPGPPGM